ncbi:MAG: hypothetical protein ACI8XO_004893 [Verrucomicrobiales bacterium]
MPLLLIDLQFFELFGDVFACRFGIHVFVDRQDLALFADVKRVAVGEPAKFGHHPIGLGRLALLVGEDRVVELEFLGELLRVALAAVAGGEVFDCELLDLFATLTERLTLDCSPSGEHLREPGDYDGFLPLEFRKLIGLAVAALEFEIRRVVANFQFRKTGGYGECDGDERGAEEFHWISLGWLTG